MTFNLKFQFELSMQIVRHYLTKSHGLAKKASKYKTNYSHFFTMFWYHWIFPWNKFYLLKIIPFKLFVVHFVSSRLLLTSTYPMLLFSYYYFFFVSISCCSVFLYAFWADILLQQRTRFHFVHKTINSVCW